jgi:hypothetical protein
LFHGFAVALPAAGDVIHLAAGDDRAGPGEQLVAVGVWGVVEQPGVQSVAAVAQPVAAPVVLARHEAVDRNARVQDHLGHGRAPCLSWAHIGTTIGATPDRHRHAADDRPPMVRC